MTENIENGENGETVARMSREDFAKYVAKSTGKMAPAVMVMYETATTLAEEIAQDRATVAAASGSLNGKALGELLANSDAPEAVNYRAAVEAVKAAREAVIAALTPKVESGDLDAAKSRLAENVAALKTTTTAFTTSVVSLLKDKDVRETVLANFPTPPRTRIAKSAGSEHLDSWRVSGFTFTVDGTEYPNLISVGKALGFENGLTVRDAFGAQYGKESAKYPERIEVTVADSDGADVTVHGTRKERKARGV